MMPDGTFISGAGDDTCPRHIIDVDEMTERRGSVMISKITPHADAD